MRRVWIWTSVVAIALTLSACDDDSSDTTSQDTEESSTTSTAPSPPPTEPTTELPNNEVSGKSELADGRHFGYWKTFEVGDATAFGEFDLAYFLTGEEAEKAAAKKGETVENDYYIVNENPKLRTLITRGDAEVRLLSDDRSTPRKSNVADFAVERHKEAGFWVTIKDGIVTKIEEQYQP